MAKINRLPLGWLGFLGIKNGGQYPQDTSPVLLPTFDLAAMYYSANGEYLAATQAVAAIGGVTFFTVPNGETWWVLGASAQSVTLGAGQTIEFVLQTTDPGNQATILLSSAQGPRTVGARAATLLEDPVFLTPGATLGISCMALVAGPVNVSLGARIARLQI